MNEPRPRMTSARPFDIALSVEKRWKTRTGSSELSTVTAEPSRIRLVRAGDRGEHDFGRRDGEVGAVVLADADEIDAELVGEHGLADHVADDLRMGQQPAIGAGRDVAERVQPELELQWHFVPAHG